VPNSNATAAAGRVVDNSTNPRAAIDTNARPAGYDGRKIIHNIGLCRGPIRSDTQTTPAVRQMDLPASKGTGPERR